MRLPITLCLILLSISLVYSFYIDDYLYPTEKPDIVYQENFTLGGSSYKLIKISNVESFLLRNGTPLQNASEVETVIKIYYKEKYAPTPAEIDEVNSLLTAYNSSRNDGSRWKGMEETSCIKMLHSEGSFKYAGKSIYCTADDNSSCIKISAAIYGITETIKQNWPYSMFYNRYTDFVFASNNMTKFMDTSFSYLGNMTDDTMYQAFKYVKDVIPNIKKSENTMETNLLRSPSLSKSDYENCTSASTVLYRCAWMCPDINISESYIDSLSSKLDALLTKMEPFANYKERTMQLVTNTEKRLSFRKGENDASLYLSKYGPLKKEEQKIVFDADVAIIHVDNETFKLKLEQLNELDKKINESIEKRNFTTMDADLEEYVLLSAYIQNKTPIVFAAYNDTYNSRERVNALVFATQTKGELSQELKAKLDNAINATILLDAKFTKGMTMDEYAVMREEYNNISLDVTSILQQQKEFIALSKFRSLSRRINLGLYDFAESTNIVKPALLAENAGYIPAAIGGLTWVSLSSFAFLVFISLVSNRKPKQSKLIPLLILFIVIGGITLFSIMLYFYTDKTSNSADVEEFMISTGNKKNVSILLYLQDAPGDAVESMKTCANALKKSLSISNKTVSLYEIYDNSCTLDGVGSNKTSAECGPSANETALIFKYSSLAAKPSFSAIFNEKAYISGDAPYFNSCQIAAVFKW